MDDHAAIAREITAARARIAATAEALRYRADVRARVGEEVSDRLAGARSSVRERFAEIAAAFNGNGRTANHEAAPDAGDGHGARAEAWSSPATERFDDAALDEGVVGDVSLASAAGDAVCVDLAHTAQPESRGRSRNLVLVVAIALATAFIAWFLFAKRRSRELQDRDPA